MNHLSDRLLADAGCDLHQAGEDLITIDFDDADVDAKGEKDVMVVLD